MSSNTFPLLGKVLYQIYPRSFKATGESPIGTIAGITSKLDHLAGNESSLEVDAIWLSPFYPSPLKDFGYDISDYTDVDSMYGTLDDFRELLREAHVRGLKVLIDFVPNHTSDQHPWFLESANSPQAEKSDWYVWRDAADDGGPPNNWLAVFGGSAWEYSQQRHQYYLHSFLAEQPDLNWENPAVVNAMQDVLRFWLDMGVDGFRVDAVQHIAKDPDYRDDPVNDEYDITINSDYNQQRPENSQGYKQLTTLLKLMEDVVEQYDDRCLIYEVHPRWRDDNIEERLLRDMNQNLSAPFALGFITKEWSKRRIENYLRLISDSSKEKGTAVYALGNHDESRLVSRYGKHAARASAVMLMTLPGVATVYYGEEIGMRDGVVPIELIQDPFALSQGSKGFGRDPERTPMQWTNDEFAGFSDVEPWLPISTLETVQEQVDDPESLLTMYRELIRIRSEHPSLHDGTIEIVDMGESVLAFKRVLPDEPTILTVINFTEEQYSFNDLFAGREIFNSMPNSDGNVLDAWQAGIYELPA